MKSVKVPLKELNNTRKKLMEKQLMNMDYKIKTQDDYGFIPINTQDFKCDYEIVDVELEAMKRYPKNISELLKDDLTSKEIEDLKTSFDIIGDIVIVEIPENLEEKKSKIGKATLEFTKRKSVYMKKSAIHGTIRIRDLELIAGENNPVTVHKEHGTRLKLNVEEVYFSPRLATERKRVSDSVKENENILDMARYLSEIDKPIWIRHVLVPERSDYDEDLIELDHFISTLSNVYRVEILPYHTLGVFKWEELKIPYQLEGIKPPTKERVDNAKRLLHVDRYTRYLDN